MHTVQIGRFHRKLPAAWSELTPRQLLRLTPLLFAAGDVVRTKVRLLQQLLALPAGYWAGLTSFQVADLLHLVKFLTEPSRLTTQLLPRLGPWYAPLAGPGTWLGNVTLWEFTNAERWLRAWVKDGGTESLDTLIAVLYRARTWGHWLRRWHPAYTGDARQAFNSKSIAGRVKRIGRLPLAQRQAVLLYYLGCRAQLETAYPHVFSGEEGNAKEAEPWLTLIGRLPSDKFGDIEQVGNRPLHTVLYYTNQFIRDAEKD